MAEFKKRFYEKNSNKSETHAGAMVKNNDREVADMPQDVHYKPWPKGGEYGTITINNGGTLDIFNNVSGGVTLPNNFVLNSMGRSQSLGALCPNWGSSPITLTGSITLAGSSRMGTTPTARSNQRFDGVVSGPGTLYTDAIQDAGNACGPCVLNNTANSYYGGTVLETGFLKVARGQLCGHAAGHGHRHGRRHQPALGRRPGHALEQHPAWEQRGPKLGRYLERPGTPGVRLQRRGDHAGRQRQLHGATQIVDYCAGGTMIFNQAIGGTGGLSFYAGANLCQISTRYLKGGPSTYTGGTTVAGADYACALVQLQGGSLPATTTLTLADGHWAVRGSANSDAVLDLNGYNQTLGRH